MKHNKSTLKLKFNVKVALAGLSILTSFNAIGATTKDLALECAGTYQVLKSVPYYISNAGTRAFPRAGTNEVVKVLTQTGKDCELLKTHYGIKLEVGEEVKHSESILTGFALQHYIGIGPAKKLAESRLGNVFPYAVNQSFIYVTKSGYLPLFPTVHLETAHLLNQTGKADAHALYGTLPKGELDDFTKVKIVREAASHLGWGKVYQGTSGGLFQHNHFLNLILELTPSEEDNIKQYATYLLTIFKNTARFKTNFVSFSPGVLLGQKINILLNEHGESKWATQLESLKNHPMLFDSQIVGWAFQAPKAPELTEEEVESFLEHALETSLNLAKVSQVLEAMYLLGQYQTAAKTILKYANSQRDLYTLTQESKNLIEQILEVK